MTELKNKLPYAAYSQLLEKTNNFSKLDALYGYLAKISMEYNIAAEPNYPSSRSSSRTLRKARP